MSIQITDDNSSGLTEEAAEAALMASFDPPADDGEGDDDGAADEDVDAGEADPSDAPEDEEEADEPEGDDEGDNDDDGQSDPPAAQPLTDEQEVEVTINGEAQKFTLGNLKRLAGQEASLTRKSQEAELVGARAAAGLQAAIEVLHEDLEPYNDVDWLVAQQQMEPETFQWHRENAKRLQSKLTKLIEAAKGVETSFAERRQSINADAVKAVADELQADIPGWNDKAMADVLAYGESQGLSAEDLKAVTNPKVIKIIRQAMLGAKAQEVATTKVAALPTKVPKSGNRTTDPTASRKQAAIKAEKRLATSGSEDDAVAALMGRWG